MIASLVVWYFSFEYLDLYLLSDIDLYINFLLVCCLEENMDFQKYLLVVQNYYSVM